MKRSSEVQGKKNSIERKEKKRKEKEGGRGAGGGSGGGSRITMRPG
jgi:hypothetical protein